MYFTEDFDVIQMSPATASPAPAAPRAAPVAAAGVSEFAVALATVLVPGAAAEAGEALLPGRQALAAGGKKLPGLDEKLGDSETDQDSDSDADASDASFAWFAAPVTTDPARTGFSQAGKPAPRPITLGSSPDGNTPTGAPPALDAAALQPGGTTPTNADGTAPTSKPAPQPVDVPTVSIVLPTESKPELFAKSDAATTATPPQPVALPSVEATLEVPALVTRPVLASALVLSPDTSASRRLIREIAGATFAPPAPDAPSAPAIAAAADMQQAALDTRRHEWMGAMIDRIETMRDASNTGDTRIRLAPAALGQVDISIRHEGDRIHVHFAAETQAARQLLTDAQPRLNELAEARGVKLGQTTVDSGTAGSGQQQNAATHQPVLPPPASVATTDVAGDTDQRIA
ncbi:flagellar hook-length control protein FliK [Sphingomonas sp. JC676]|uniref:flagellar hook-length control protein FliK n=1 Tax=Sphingomonas sp. JC676 TaxID=2768065 RepID=UPI0016577836|nr:flagellar hook-length control protein FliK [Sphingomonas sp. JC676]MBC9034477.1 flagellar hook-length control protein FliK [Sphingomonas sp. JC676]